jgi:hypothetical protein
MAETEGWGEMVQVHDDEKEMQGVLGGTGRPHAIVSIWWD